MAHTLLNLSRCVAPVTQRLVERRSRRGHAFALPAVLFAIVVATATAGCFNQPINRAPVISKIDQAGQPFRGMAATFMADGYDPDQDQLTWTWDAKPAAGDSCPDPNVPARCSCPDPSVPARWPHDTTLGQPDAPATFVVNDSSLTSSPYCVWAFATDRYGAMTADDKLVNPTDNPPVASIQLRVDPGSAVPPPGPNYPAYSTFQLAAQASDADQDPLTYTWNLDQLPNGSGVTFTPCAGKTTFDQDPTLRCFTADVPGLYQVSLAVSDGIQTTNPPPVSLMVLGDAPPCIDVTDPKYGELNKKAMTSHGSAANPDKNQPMDPASIVVTSVYDDGDPYPVPEGGKGPQFFWYLSKNSDKLQYVDYVDYQELTLASDNYTIGDVINVRLEVKDRNPDAVDKILASCGDADFCSTPTIPAGRVDCYVRVSWKILLDL